MSVHRRDQEMWTVLFLHITRIIHSYGDGKIDYDYVRSVFEDDPLVQEALAREGPDWRLVPHDTECQYNPLRNTCQDLKTCHLDDPVAKIRRLSQCRRECRDIHGPMFEAESFGGTDDFIDQHFGFRIPACSLTEGLSEVTMAQMIAKKVIQMYADYVPAFTTHGFQKAQVPKDLFKQLVDYRDESLRSGNFVQEAFDTWVINGPTVIQNEKLKKSKEITINRAFLMSLDKFTKQSILKTIGPLAEKWADIKLIPTSVYGIRRYRNMSTLLSHVDHLGTHVISAIINVDQEVEEDWPLYIQDNMGGDHEVILRPGEMIWYESARLIHGRQRPLRGHHYDNVFVHFKPQGLWYVRMKPDDPRTKISAEAVRESQRLMD